MMRCDRARHCFESVDRNCRQPRRTSKHRAWAVNSFVGVGRLRAEARQVRRRTQSSSAHLSWEVLTVCTRATKDQHCSLLRSGFLLAAFDAHRQTYLVNNTALRPN